MLTHLQSKKAMAEQIHDGYIYFKLVKSGHLCGYYAIRKEGERLFLSKLYIQKDYRGMGLSSKTFRFLKELCRNDHLHTIYLTCNKYNSSTLAIYKHAGFQIIREAVTDIGGGFVMDDYMLELPV